MIAPIRGILLDFYGTLVLEDDAIIPGICEEIRRTAPMSATTQEIGHRWWTVFQEICHDATGKAFIPQREAAIRSLARTIREFDSRADPETIIQPQFAHWRTSSLFPDATPFLRFLRSRGLPVCVLSNIDRADIEAVMALHGLRFDGLVTSDDARAYKPRPEMFRMGLDQLGLAADAVLHVGDSRSSDVAGALALSIPVAWIDRNARRPASDPGADHVVTNLTELVSIIRQRA